MDKDKGFWSTLPGIITAVAALLTAVGGLVTALYTVGPFKPSDSSLSASSMGSDAGAFDPEDDDASPATPEGQGEASTAADLGEDAGDEPTANPAAEPLPEPASEPAPRLTEVVEVLPNTQGMGADGVSGSLITGSDRSFSPPSFGDRGRGKQVRGFLSFELGDVLSGDEIAGARLHLSQGGRSGDLNRRYFQSVIVEAISVDGRLGETHFDEPGLLIARIPIEDLTAEPINVTRAVQRASRTSSGRVTFRFRFSVGNDNDDDADAWALSSTRGRTRLEVEVRR